MTMATKARANSPSNRLQLARSFSLLLPPSFSLLFAFSPSSSPPPFCRSSFPRSISACLPFQHQHYLSVLGEALDVVWLVHLRDLKVQQLHATLQPLPTRVHKPHGVGHDRAKRVLVHVVCFEPAQLCDEATQATQLRRHKGLLLLRVKQHLKRPLLQLKLLRCGDGAQGFGHKLCQRLHSNILRIPEVAVLENEPEQGKSGRRGGGEG